MLPRSIFAWMMALGLPLTCWGQEAAPPPARSNPAFRPILIPHSQTGRLVNGLVPMKKDEFRKRWALLKPKEAAPRWSARITRAHYAATLEGETWSEGKGEYDVEPRSDAVPAVLHFGQSHLPMYAVEWTREGGESQSPLWGSGPDGAVRLAVPEKGVFSFQWSLRGERNANGEINFDFQVPASLSNTFELTTPPDVVLRTSHGIAQQIDSRDQDAIVWRVDVGGRTRFTLTATKTSEPATRTVSVAQTASYLFNRGGLEADIELQVHVHGGPLAFLSLNASSDLTPVAVWQGERLLDEDALQVESGDGWSLWRIATPKLMRGASEPLRIRAFAKVVLDEEWAVPQVRAAEDDWRSTSLSIEVDPEIELRRFAVEDSHHQGVSRLANGNLRLQFQHFDPSGSVRLLLGEQQVESRIQSGLDLRLTQDKITARLIADIRANRDELFTCLVAPQAGWRITSVASDPPDAIADAELEWSSDQAFVVPFRTPATTDQPIRLIIEGVRDYAGEASQIRLRNARLASFPEAANERRLVRISGGPSGQVTLMDDVGVFRLAGNELFEDETQRLGGVSGVLFEESPSVAPAVASLQPQTLSFDATLKVEFDVGAKRTTERYEITCSPQSLSLNTVVVGLTPALPGDIDWSITDQPDALLSAVREGDGADGELWRITLRRPAEASLVLVGLRESPSEGITQAPLPDVLGASSQVATINVRSSEAFPIRLEARGMEAIPPPIVRPDQYSTVRGVFRHEPPRRASLQIVPLIDVATPCWVWNLNTRARIEANGSIGYRCELEVENSGAEYLRVQAPPRAMDWAAEVDGEEVSAVKSEGVITIPLPSRRRFPTVTVRFRTEGARLQVMNSAHLASLQPLAPVLRRSWRIVLPPGFKTWPKHRDDWDWRDRLFGGSLATLLAQVQQETETFAGAGDSTYTRSLELLAQTVKEGGTEATIGDIVTEWTRKLAGQGVVVWADQLMFANLAELRVTDAAEETAEPSANAVGAQWLEAAGLKLEHVGNRWLLQTTASPSYGRVEDSLAPLHEWIRRDASPSPWIIDNTELLESGGRQELQRGDVASAPIRFFNERVLAAWEWSVLCLTLGLVLLFANRYFRLVFALTAILVSVCLWAPPEIVFLSRGAVYGAWLAGLASLFSLRRSPPSARRRASREPDSTRTHVNVTAVGILILALVIGVQSAIAQDPAPLSRFGLADKVPHVLIPTDENRKPVGDYYYVAPEFYRRLVQADSPSTEGELPWLLTEARYALTAAQAQLANINARLSYTVRRPGTIAAPFVPGRVIAAFWDGRPIQFTRQQEAIEFYAPLAGEHELELLLAPELPGDAKAVYSIEIPQTANTIVTLDGDASLKDVQFPTAKGAVRNDSPGHWEVFLGGSDKIVVSWKGLGESLDAREVETDELYWLRVRPQAVSLEAKINIRALRSGVQEFQILAAPSLQLLNIAADQGIVGHEKAEFSPDWVRHRFALAEPIEDERSFRLSFLWKGLAGVGRIQAPRLQVDAKYVRDRRLALSVAPPLLSELSGEGWEPLAPTDFAVAWGDDGAPGSAFRAPREPQPWTLRTRYPLVDTEATASLVCVIGNERVSYELLTQFSDRDAEAFQHTLLVPPHFHVTSATLIEPGRERDIRPQQEPQGRITLLTERPWQEETRLVLRGELPRNADAEPGSDSIIEIPNFQLQDGRLTVETIRIYRQHDVRPIQWLETAGFSRDASSETPFSGNYGRLEGVLTRTEGAPQVRLRASMKPPVVADGQISTALIRREGGWHAIANVRVASRNQSPMDVVRFEIPKEWTDLELDPEWPFRIAPLPGESRRQLLVYLPAPTRVASLMLRGKMTLEGEERLRQAPEITPLDLNRLTRYVVLPMRLDNQEYIWELSGREEDPPQDLRQNLALAGEYQSFLLAPGATRANLQATRQRTGKLKLLAANYRVQWRSPTEWFGTADFDVEPSGQNTCLLSVPSETELLRVQIGQLVFPIPKSETSRSLLLPLGADQLPQRVSATFTARISGGRPPTAPFLAATDNSPLDCPQTHWITSTGPKRLQLASSASAGEETDSVQQDLQRLRALLDVLQAGDASDDQVPLDNLASWKLAWQQRLAALEVRLSGQLPRLGEEAPARAQEVRNAIAESAAIQSQVLRMTSEGIGNDLPPSVWTNVQELGADTRRVSFTGQLQPQNPFTAAYAPAPASSRQALSITFLALVAGLVLGARRPFAFREWARANIHVLLISIALLWWTFMPLGWIGIACTLLLLLAASSSSWRATRR